MPNFTHPIPLSLYIHLPWCVRKCPYCDFNSHALRASEIPEDAYVDALLKDLTADLPKIWGRSITSIFIGGGTPSLFSGAAINRLLAGVRALVHCVPDLEITLEANPGTAEQDRFIAYREAGVNRLSIGIQSLNDQKLKALGRIHGRDEALQAVAKARAAGFENFNLDLMYALPTQTLEEALTDLHSVIDLKPTHLSWYHLTLEPNTLFYHQPPSLPDDDLSADIQQQGEILLEQNGFVHYEVSAYAQAGKQCRHNLNYWQFGDYLGIGAGAHSKITDFNLQTITRFSKFKNPRDYLAADKPFIAEQQILNPEEIPLEFMLNALRLYQPIMIEDFIAKTGLPFSCIAKPLQKAQQLGLINIEEDRFTTSIQGKRFLNNLVELFMPK